MTQGDAMAKALDLALCILIKSEPPDSRAVSDEFVAMAAVASGDHSDRVMVVIDDALAKERGLSVMSENEKAG
jgi:hypothetical protein